MLCWASMPLQGEVGSEGANISQVTSPRVYRGIKEVREKERERKSTLRGSGFK